MDKTRWVVTGIILGLLLFFCDGLRAKGNEKIGFIDAKQIFEEYEKKKEYDKVLEKIVKDKEGEISKQGEEIKRLGEELEIKSEKEKLKIQEEMDEKSRKMADFKRAAGNELDAENDKLVREIVIEINDVAKEYGEKEGYSFILKKSAILYGDKGIDLTDDIIGILNDKYKKRKEQ